MSRWRRSDTMLAKISLIALFAFERLQKGAVVKNQHAADAECLVAPAGAEQKLFQVCGGKIFRSGAGIDNLMHASLLNSGGKA
jgi:hypothetical protein